MVTSCVNQRVLVNSYMVELNKALKNKAITNFNFRNFSMETVIECFNACLEDCLCLSFQTCNETECHLLSSNQHLSTLVTKMECTYYDMRPTASQQVRNLLLVLKKNRMNLITWKNEVGLDIGLDCSGGATGWTGGDESPPFVTEANFLIRPNPVRKGGGVR